MRRVVLAVVGALIAGLLPAAAATAQQCQPAGGQSVPRPIPPEGDFQVTGAGWGHGVGLSQYGAQGAAKLGCDAATILQTYFPGVQVAPTSLPPNIRVNLFTAATRLTVEALDGAVPWRLCTDGVCQDLPTQPRGATWTVEVLPDAKYAIADSGRLVWSGGDRYALLRADFDGTVVRVPEARHRYRWGALELDSVARDPGAAMFANLDIAPFDRYLYGLAEVPSSWPAEALKAQVIAARSYALVRREAYNGRRETCRCDVYATVSDQVYSGWDKEAEAGYGQRWVDAVDATRAADFSSALTMRYEGRTADAFYSSTHGGHSESSAFTWGGAVPYLQPVDDSRWELASDSAEAGVRSWALSVSAQQLGQAAGVGVATDVRLPEPKGAAGRVGHPDRGYGGVVVTGTTGTRTLSGDQLRRGLGLRSTLFDIRPGGPVDQPSPQPSESPPDLPIPQPSEAPSELPFASSKVTRVAGSDRVGTAVAVSARHWATSSDAVLATA
ncbi:MAG: SpoIID/LytB domain-containing protein, partial [Actinomycetota bacterium]|nr:SpoIID/LytB domain-containing protein [Actinomycetota bacterium]